ncbi:MAG: hypothetical protein ACRDRK_15845 [Pseudonocardia sp.]
MSSTAVDPSGVHDAPRPLARVVGLILVLTAAAVLGANAVGSTTIVFAVVMLVAVLALINGRPVVWIALAITVVWTSRLLTTAGWAPRFLDFADFPLVLVAFLFAGVRFLSSDRRLPPAQRKILRWLLAFSVVIALSWAFKGLAEPQRLVAGLVLAAEPFLLLIAVLITPMTARERKRLVILTSILLCVQVVFSLAQYPFAAHPDEVKGTLLGTGAGHHVSAGGAALGFLILARQRVPKTFLLAYGAAALFVMIASDAKQVMVVLPLALLVLGVSGRKRSGSAVSLIGGLLAGVLMAGAAFYALVTYQASSTALTFADRSFENRTGKFAVAEAVWDDVTATVPTALLGLGPGQSVSRFSFLTTPDLLKEGSPVTLIGLSQSEGADRYQGIAIGGPLTVNSSFISAQCSALGVLGDYGLLGLFVFGGLIWAVLGALRKAGDRRLRSSALASWALLLPLSVAFDWLEQPPFTLAVALITGLALRGPGNLDQAHGTSSGALPESPVPPVATRSVVGTSSSEPSPKPRRDHDPHDHD